MSLPFTEPIKRLIPAERKIDDEEKIKWTTRIVMFFAGVAAAIAIAVWLRRLKQEDVLDNEYRRKIVDVLERDQIAHLRHLHRKVQCGMSILLWHLEVLEDFNIVAKAKHGRYIAYYLKQSQPPPELIKAYFAIINDTARQIVNEMLKTETITMEELESHLSIERRTIKYHLQKLEDLGIISGTKGKDLRINSPYKDYLAQLITRHAVAG